MLKLFEEAFLSWDEWGKGLLYMLCCKYCCKFV